MDASILQSVIELLSGYVVVVILAICLGIGYIIKHSLKSIPNDLIPLILGILGVILNSWANAWQISPEILLGGLASGLTSVGVFELSKGIVKEFGGK
jgi:hypothetical protein